MIAIIIPFYQRRPGLLQTAIRSVLNQSVSAPWHVIVIDDGSPVSADDELAPLKGALGERLTFIKQVNRGVSAARNLALDTLTSATEIVAFLDSDDAWDPGHLERILAAWDAGAELYFENCQRHDAPHSWFTEIGLNPGPASCFNSEHQLHWFEGDFFDAVIRRSPALPSTTAYKFCVMPQLRFPVGQSPGEDNYFCMQASRFVRKIAYSTTNAVALGAGVNVSLADWGTVGDIKRLLGERRYHHLIEQLPLTDAQRALNRATIQGLNVDFWRAVLATTRRREYRHGRFVQSYLALQPSAVAQFPAALVQSLMAKAGQIVTTRR